MRHLIDRVNAGIRAAGADGGNRMRGELGRGRVSCYGVCLCERESVSDGIRVMPVADFLRRLWDGEVLP